MYQDGRHMLVGGSYRPGIWNDNVIFNDGLVHYLEVGERCEADDGYRGSAPVYAKCPAVDFVGPDEVAMKQRARNRQETVNKRFKNWAILASPYRHQLLDHQQVFGAVAVLTQLSLAENPLFQVEYND